MHPRRGPFSLTNFFLNSSSRIAAGSLNFLLMTADDRLNQLEPLLSGALRILDQHTTQLNQIASAVGRLGVAADQQSDNISFVLREQLELKTQQQEQQQQLKAQLVEIRGEQYVAKINFDVVRGHLAEITNRQDGVQSQLSAMQTQLDGNTGKLDQVLQLLQKPGK